MTSPARDPLRVLFVARWYPSHDQPWRGSFVADLATALTSSGVEVEVASFEATHVRGVTASRAERQAAAFDDLGTATAGPDALNRPRRWAVPGLSVARLPVFLDGERRRPEDLIEAHRRALLPFGRGAFARQPFDLIHAHTGLPDGAAAAELADELGVPLVVTEHSSTALAELADAGSRAAYLGLLEGRHRVVAVSEVLATRLADALGVEADRIGVVPNAVPVDAFPQGTTPRDPGLLLYVGSRKASKGIATLLTAVAFVRQDRPDLNLRLIGPAGNPEEEARWKAMGVELGFEGGLTFEAAVRRETVAEAMQTAGVFVHASPLETFGMVAAEALASGLPVAATPSGGVDEIVGRDGRFGVIAAGHDPESLAAAIEEVLGRRERLDPAAMRTHIVETYGAPVVAGRTLMLYGRLLGTPIEPIDSGLSTVETSERPLSPPPLTGTRVPGRRTAASTRLPLVLAMARGQAVDRVGLLPQTVASRLTIVTSLRGKYADDRDLPSIGTWDELDPERFARDALAAFDREQAAGGGLSRLTGPFRARSIRERRAELEGRRDEIRASGVRDFLLRAAREGGVLETNDEGWIVCLDADDVVLARTVAAHGLHLAPGGLRWLADRWAGG